MKKSVMTVVALIALAAGAAKADEITLASPLAGATLRANGVDMSVTWAEIGGETAYEVLAVYAAQEGGYEPSHLVMALEDGDRVSFALPGVENASYTFYRAGDVVSVATGDVERKVAIR